MGWSMMKVGLKTTGVGNNYNCEYQIKIKIKVLNFDFTSMHTWNRKYAEGYICVAFNTIEIIISALLSSLYACMLYGALYL